MPKFLLLRIVRI